MKFSLSVISVILNQPYTRLLKNCKMFGILAILHVSEKAGEILMILKNYNIM